MSTMYLIVDEYGRSYFEGQTFCRDEAIRLAGEIGPDERPCGVIVVPDDGEGSSGIAVHKYPAPVRGVDCAAKVEMKTDLEPKYEHSRKLGIAEGYLMHIRALANNPDRDRDATLREIAELARQALVRTGVPA